MSAVSIATERANALQDKGGFDALPAVEGRLACLTCFAGAHDEPDADMWIAVGFGSAGLTMNGSSIWEENHDWREDSEEPPLTLRDAETLAETRPNNDWRIFKHAPLYDAVYQRQGEGRWVLIESGEGFA